MSTYATTGRRSFQFGLGAMLVVITMVALLLLAFREHSARLQQAAESAAREARLKVELQQLNARLSVELQTRNSLQQILQSREFQAATQAANSKSKPHEVPTP